MMSMIHVLLSSEFFVHDILSISVDYIKRLFVRFVIILISLQWLSPLLDNQEAFIPYLTAFYLRWSFRVRFCNSSFGLFR